METGWYLDRRLLILKILLVLIFGGLLGVFWRVQVFKNERYTTLSQENRVRKVWIAAPRGKILDRNGNVLVDNRPSFDVSLEYEALKERKAAVDFLSRVLHLKPEEIEQSIKKYRGPMYLSIPIQKDVNMETLTQVEEAKLQVPWVTIEANPVRKYLYGPFASALLGYVRAIDKGEYQELKDRGYHWLDVIGKSGIEKACEAYLKGEAGGMQIEVDHRGQREQVLSIKKPIPGRDVYLTIDKKAQDALEEVLADKIGAGLMMNPNTGEILGVVSKPSFDLNLFIRPDLKEEMAKLFNDPLKPLVNRAFQGMYGPGSIFKIVVASAGLDTGVARRGDSVYCQGGLKVGGSYFRCWKEGGHGHIKILSAIQYSCNVFFYTLGLRLGPDRIADYAHRFGFGYPTGLDIGGEREGFIPTPEWKRRKLHDAWYGGDTANFSIGQGFVLVTPLQLATVISSIANGGKKVNPFLVKKVVLPEGRTLFEVMGSKETSDLNISKKVLAKIRKAMWLVVNGHRGTGHLARLENVEVCGKTGTVQVKKGEDFVKQGWFVSFAPYKNAQVVLVLIVEGVYSGGQDVAPLAKKILERYFSR